MQDIINKGKEITGLIWVLVGLQIVPNSSNCLLVLYPKEKVDRYEVNELLYGEVMFSNIVVKSIDISLTSIDETNQTVLKFIREVYQYNHLVPLIAYQNKRTIYVVLALERPLKNIAGKMFFYFNHYKTAKELPGKKTIDKYIQMVLPIDL